MPSAHSIYISSSNSRFRKAVQTSILWSSPLFSANRGSRSHSVVNLARGAKASWKAIPLSWEYPLATRRTLYLLSSLCLNSHRQPTRFQSLGTFDITQVLCLRSDSNSFSQAHLHALPSSALRSSCNVKESWLRSIKASSPDG